MITGLSVDEMAFGISKGLSMYETIQCKKISNDSGISFNLVVQNVIKADEFICKCYANFTG